MNVFIVTDEDNEVLEVFSSMASVENYFNNLYGYIEISIPDLSMIDAKIAVNKPKNGEVWMFERFYYVTEHVVLD